MSDVTATAAEELHLPIVSVTLMEDRASVRRAATVTLDAGSHRFLVNGVSPVISDKTLHATSSSPAAKMLDLRVIRQTRPASRPSSPATDDLWRQVQTQTAICQASEREVDRLSLLSANYCDLAKRWGQEVSIDAVSAASDPSRWAEDWTALRERLSTLGERLADSRRRWQGEKKLLGDLTRRYQAAMSPSASVGASLELTLLLDATASFEVQVEYCVPNACWRPYHVAEWSGGELLFRSQACLWQNTGESWNDVALHFSTQRATLGTEAPPLVADYLSLQPKPKHTAVTTREQTIHKVEERASGVPGIDSGGEALRFVSPDLATVASDGRPHRVPLFSFTAAAREERVVMAELRREVFVRTRLENMSGFPILAGPVDLIKSCGLVGRGYLEFVATGETFEISWGPHPELRCQREQQTMAEEKSIISGWRTKEHRVEVHLSNLGPHLLSLEVLERLPISELKSVKIEQDLGKTTSRVAADANGFLKFPVDLPPFGRQTVTLAYLVSHKKDVEGL